MIRLGPLFWWASPSNIFNKGLSNKILPFLGSVVMVPGTVAGSVAITISNETTLPDKKRCEDSCLHLEYIIMGP